MQKIVVPVAALLCAFSLVSCNQEKYLKNHKAGEAWLANYTRGAGISVDGTWAAAEWGDGTFVQKGRNVTGTLGNYAVRGVVSGGKVYLLLTSDGWVHYTAILEKSSPKILSGFYSPGVPYDSLDQQDFTLRRW